MTDNLTLEENPPISIDLDELLTTAIAQKEALLKEFPRLRSLQAEIDRHLSPDQPLAERFLAMGTVHSRFHRTSIF